MELKDLQGNDIDQFVRNYRKSLGQQYDAGVATLNQQRANDFAGIMAGSNKAGMLYSNFGQRDKIKYDTQSFYPAQVKAFQSYQTALQKLRENTINLYNQNKSIQEAIKDLNEV